MSFSRYMLGLYFDEISKTQDKMNKQEETLCVKEIDVRDVGAWESFMDVKSTLVSVGGAALSVHAVLERSLYTP